MHTRASNSELVELLPEPERTLNRRLHRRNRRVPFEQRNERPEQPRVVYPPILDINYFRHFFDILKNYNPMDDEPMWAADRVVALTPGSAITIPETANEFVIKDKVLLKLDWAKNQKTKSSLKKTVAFADEDDDKPMSPEEEANFMQTFRHTRVYNDYRGRDSNRDNCEDEDEESTPQLKSQTPKPVKETPIPKPYKPKIPYPQRYRKEKMEAQMPNYGKFLKELVSNKHKLEQISSAFLSDESSAMIQNKVPPKHGDPKSFLIPCNFSKAFSCNALADIGASINLMPYSLYAKLSLKTLKPTKMSVRLADRSFQHPIRIAENMLVEVGKFTFPVDFVILEMEEDSKVSLILRRPFLHTANAVIQVKQKQLNLGVGTERITFSINFAMKHSYSNDDTCFSIDLINEILEEDYDALLDKGSKILHFIEGTILE
ncbi:reverse transcriptase domain-containing protein [Tanacetum coccineum]